MPCIMKLPGGTDVYFPPLKNNPNIDNKINYDTEKSLIHFACDYRWLPKVILFLLVSLGILVFQKYNIINIATFLFFSSLNRPLLITLSDSNSSTSITLSVSHSVVSKVSRLQHYSMTSRISHIVPTGSGCEWESRPAS